MGTVDPGRLLTAIAAADLLRGGQTMTTRVRADGKIRLPDALLKRYALRPGTQVRLVETRVGILLVPLTDQPMSRELQAELDSWAPVADGCPASTGVTWQDAARADRDLA